MRTYRDLPLGVAFGEYFLDPTRDVWEGITRKLKVHYRPEIMQKIAYTSRPLQGLL